MIDIPRSELKTQNRVIDLFTSTTGADALGYRYLGEGNKREANRPIETELLRADLAARGYTAAQIAAALQRLEIAVDTTGTTLYQANLKTYLLLRYGVPVQTATGQAHETVHRALAAHLHRGRPLEFSGPPPQDRRQPAWRTIAHGAAQPAATRRAVAANRIRPPRTGVQGHGPGGRPHRCGHRRSRTLQTAGHRGASPTGAAARGA